MSVEVYLGCQWGDEGKGRFVDLEASNSDAVARGRGGKNAGHTVLPEGFRESIDLHQVPSGIAHPSVFNIIGNGVYFDPIGIKTEISKIKDMGIKVSPENLMISSAAHLVFPDHIERDKNRENTSKMQGSTKVGIAYAASAKHLRENKRVEEIRNPFDLTQIAYEGLARFYEDRNLQSGKSLSSEFKISLALRAEQWVNALRELEPYIGDTVQEINERIDKGQKILAEGAQGHWLDIDHGMYPSVTSSPTTANGLLDGLGIAPKHLSKVVGIAKLTKSLVGGNNFLTQIHDEETLARLRGNPQDVDSEFGTTTERPRDMGYPDLVEIRNSIRASGVDELIITKMDCANRYGKTMLVATEYELDGDTLKFAPTNPEEYSRATPIYTEMKTWGDISNIRKSKDLPKEAIDFVAFTEEQLGVRVSKLGVGPQREQYINL